MSAGHVHEPGQGCYLDEKAAGLAVAVYSGWQVYLYCLMLLPVGLSRSNLPAAAVLSLNINLSIP